MKAASGPTSRLQTDRSPHLGVFSPIFVNPRDCGCPVLGPVQQDAQRWNIFAFTPVKVPLFVRTIVTDVHLSVKFTERAKAETDRDSLRWDVVEVARTLFTVID